MGGTNLVGCALALCSICCMSAYWTLGDALGVSIIPCLWLAGVSNALFALILLAAVGSGLHAPVSAASGAAILFNCVTNSAGMLLLVAGSLETPGPEVALILLLEPALSPFLVYFAVGESPSAQTVVAGVLIVLTLLAHGVYEKWWFESPKGGAGGEGGADESRPEEGMELLSARGAAGEDEEEEAGAGGGGTLLGARGAEKSG